MAIARVEVGPIVFECEDCGAKTVDKQELLDRGFHEAHDDDCPCAWDPKVTTIAIVYQPEIWVTVE